MKCVNMAVKEMKTLGMAKQDFKRIRKQAKKKARKCTYGKSETTDGSEDTEDDEEDTTTEDSGDDGAEKDCTTILKENQCNNKWGGICSWNGVSCGSSSGGLGGISLGDGVAGGSFLQSSGGSVQGQGKGNGNGNGGGKLKPNKPYKPDKQGGSVNISGGGGNGNGGGKWGGNKPNKLDKPWGGGNKPQGSQGSGSAIGKVKPNQGNQEGGSSIGESEDSEGTVTTEETEDSEESEDTSEDDGEEVDCSSAPKEMPCMKKGGGVCAWINGSCQPKRRHLYLRRKEMQ